MRQIPISTVTSVVRCPSSLATPAVLKKRDCCRRKLLQRSLGGAAKKKRPFIRFGMTQDASNSNIHSYICGKMPILSCNTSGVEEEGLLSSQAPPAIPGGHQKRKGWAGEDGRGVLVFFISFAQRLCV